MNSDDRLRSHASSILRSRILRRRSACTRPALARRSRLAQRSEIPPLAAGYGPAEIDKAILDALLRGTGVNFFDGMAQNIAGIDARLSPDLDNDDISRFLPGRKRLERVAIRHTVGLDDQIEGHGGVADANENAGAHYFKLKLNGDPEADAARLIRIGRELASLPYDYKVSLDANEQYADLNALGALMERLDRDDALAPIATRLLYIEQPMPRDVTWQSPLGAGMKRDFIVDEADNSYQAFPAARALGYRGISLKSCKGIYKAVVNATRAAKWTAAGDNCFVTAEDLTCQAGLAVQQDLALGALIGVTHAERNGHHYVDGFAGTPSAEAHAFLTAHPDLYADDGGNIRLSIRAGNLSTDTLTGAGLCDVGASGLVHAIAARAANTKNPAGVIDMATQRLGLVMNGVTGRMGLNQHLIRSIVAIREQGGTRLSNGDRVMPDPILVGRDAAKVEKLAKQFRIERWTTDLDRALGDRNDTVFFDAATTQARPSLLTKAIEAGKHIYCEKPIATNLDEAIAVLRLAAARGVKHGTVQDKLFLPGLKKLAFLRDSGFFGRMLSVRGEFGYWVFEGDWQQAQRPSWNYRSEDGGGIILDMVCHWRYVLDNLFGEVESVSCIGTTDIPERWDEQNKKYQATADDSAYATFRLKGGVIAHINMSWVTRVYRDDLVTFQVDGTHGSAVAGLTECMIQARQATPRPVWNPDEKRLHDFYADWQKLPDNAVYDNGFKEQWEMFIRHVCENAPYKHTLLEGAKGVQLAECALQSWRERRWIDVAPIEV